MKTQGEASGGLGGETAGFTNFIGQSYNDPNYCNLSGSTSDALAPCFQVYLFRGLTDNINHHWGTYGYVRDYYNNTDIFTRDTFPSPLP